MISKELLSEFLELTSGNVFIKEIETRNNDIEYLIGKVKEIMSQLNLI